MFKEVKKLASLASSIGILNALKIKSGKTKRILLKGIQWPIFLRAGTSDIPTFKEIFVKNQYNIKIPAVPSFIIDGGANIGLSAVYFANKFPNAQIVAIEPDKNNFSILQRNVQYYPNIHTINSGLLDKAVDVRVYNKYNTGNWGMVIEETDGDSTASNSIKSITIPEILNQFNVNQIDLLKLDIETSEKQLFSDNYKDWLSKTKVILIELHDHKLKGCSKSFFTAVNNTFKDYGFSQKGENTVIVNNDIQ